MTYLLIAIAAMTTLAVLLRYGMVAGADPYGVNLLFRGVGAVALAAAVVYSVEPSALGAAWREGGWTGLVGSGFFFLAVVAVVLMGWDRMAATGEGGIDPADRRARRWLTWALAAFLAQGGWEIALRSTREYASDDARLVFLAVGVGGAALQSLGAVRSMKARLGRRELAFGLGAGALVLVVSVSRIWALRELPGMVVFPVTTISVMVMVQLAGMGIWKERVGARGWLGFAAGLGGVLLLTLNPGGG